MLSKKRLDKEEKVEEKLTETSFAQSNQDNFRCFCCGSRDHLPDDCPKKKTTPKHKWWINAAEIPKQRDEEIYLSTNFTCNTTLDRDDTTFKEEHNKEIVLDTGCSIHALFCNPDYVTDIRKAETPLFMATSTGVIKVIEKATVPGIGEVWYDSDQPTNLLSFSLMEERFKIDYKPSTSTFDLHLDKGTITFTKKKHIYVFTPSDKYVQHIASMKQKTTINTEEKKIAAATTTPDRKFPTPPPGMNVDFIDNEWVQITRHKKKKTSTPSRMSGFAAALSYKPTPTWKQTPPVDC